MLFQSKPRKSSIQGLSVSINEGNRTPEQRYERAKCRVENLTGKLRRLNRRPSSADIENMIRQTRFAIGEWEKRMKIAEFEINLREKT